MHAFEGSILNTIVMKITPRVVQYLHCTTPLMMVHLLIPLPNSPLPIPRLLLSTLFLVVLSTSLNPVCAVVSQVLRWPGTRILHRRFHGHGPCVLLGTTFY